MSSGRVVFLMFLLSQLMGVNVMANKFSKQIKETVQNIVPSNERLVIDTVASQYKLDDEERRLLFAIRKAESGGAGREFGILDPKAMRFKDDPVRSLIIQAQWAAGTIKKRYKGNLDKFSERFAPIGASNDPTGLNKNWKSNVSHYMNELKETGYKTYEYD